MTKHKPSPDSQSPDSTNLSEAAMQAQAQAASDGADADSAKPPVDEFGLPIVGQDAAPPEDAAAVVDAALVAQIEQEAANAAFRAGVEAERADALRVAEEEAARAADAAEEQRLAEEQAERDAMVAVPVPEAVTRLAVLNEMLVRMETAMAHSPEACGKVLQAAHDDGLLLSPASDVEGAVTTLCGLPLVNCTVEHLRAWCMSARMAIMRGAA